MSNHTECPICCKPANNPWRVYDSNGRVLLGCVSAFHNDHLVPISESNRWHNCKEAKQLRRKS